MAHFEATVRLFDLVESDALAARRAVEERLQAAGFSRCQVTKVGVQPSVSPAARPHSIRTETGQPGSALLMAAMAAWALWFLWLFGD
jgi:hypothetical protein